MITSMTAYAKNEQSDADWLVSVEIRSYNSKYMDLALRTPHGYDALEERIRTIVKNAVTRGRIEIRLQIQNNSEEATTFEVNRPQAKAYYQALQDIKEYLKIGGEITLDHIAACNGLVSVTNTEKDMEAAWPIVESCLNVALAELIEMRAKEGDYLRNDFTERLRQIENDVDHIETISEGMTGYYQERLKERIEALTKGLVEIDPARIAQESAFIADRSDISEEIVRARSHIQQFRQLMASPEPAGRKLNFLLQELNREFNTMGAKTGVADAAHIIVTVKSELEKIREQVQNVE